MDINDRQKRVLSAVVEIYTQTAEPVGSAGLLAAFAFPVSSATLRADMALLERQGLLYQPHTSAGRIPTDLGLRYYVEEIMGDMQLSPTEVQKLQKEFLLLQAKHQRTLKTTAKMLSTLSGSFAVTGGRTGLADFGMRELMTSPEFSKLDELGMLVESLDSLDEKLDLILADVQPGETKIYIGAENPIKEMKNCTMMVTPFQSETGEQGIMAIIGPKRMKYARNKNILETMQSLLGGEGNPPPPRKRGTKPPPSTSRKLLKS